MTLATPPWKYYLFIRRQVILDRSKGGGMLKGLFKKPPAKATGEGTGLLLHENELLKFYVQEFCLKRHICLKNVIEMVEREIIYIVLAEAHGNQRRASRLLGVKPNTLHYKIQRMRLVPVHKYMMAEELPESEPTGPTIKPEPAPWANRHSH